VAALGGFDDAAGEDEAKQGDGKKEEGGEEEDGSWKIEDWRLEVGRGRREGGGFSALGGKEERGNARRKT
jgi:hypothetical protein